MTQRNHPQLEAFVSLVWYDTLLRFITNFIAKTSEILLAAGLVVSSANFLTDGTILGTTSAASQAWAWAQALAIDSSLAISFYHVLFCIKQRDWVKCVLYSLLTGLLALVAGTITNIDIFSHAIHASLSHSMSVMGINIEVLSSLRSIAVVGFVLMSRLRDVSFKDLTAPQADERELHLQTDAPQEEALSAKEVHITVEDVERLLQALAHQNGAPLTAPGVTGLLKGAPQHHLEPDDKHIDAEQTPQNQDNIQASDPSHLEHTEDPAPQEEPSMAPQSHPSALQESNPAPQEQSQQAPDPSLLDPGQAQKSREERLELAYQELVAGGHKISGRALAERAHMHRSFCTEWLRARQQAQRDVNANRAVKAVPDAETSELSDQGEHPP